MRCSSTLCWTGAPGPGADSVQNAVLSLRLDAQESARYHSTLQTSVLPLKTVLPLKSLAPAPAERRGA